MRKYTIFASALVVAGIVLVLSLASSDPEASAFEIIEFDEAEVFFEFNSTDLDLGIHMFFDAEDWEKVDVRGPNGTAFSVKNGGSLRDLGSTEVHTESAEPPLDEENLEQAMADFFAMFPEGEYIFTGRTIEGDRLEGSTDLTHDLPAAPELISPDPEDQEPALDPEDCVIEWADASEVGDPEVVKYHVVVEFEDEVTEEVFVFAVDVPADATALMQSITVPADFFENLEDRDGEYKVEIVAIEDGWNATIVEQEFELEEEEE